MPRAVVRIDIGRYNDPTEPVLHDKDVMASTACVGVMTAGIYWWRKLGPDLTAVALGSAPSAGSLPFWQHRSRAAQVPAVTRVCRGRKTRTRRFTAPI